ncbi:D123 domain-containing protein [Phanerochaete sordida]|uniref:D123 domain-containing protein n=1 Tax=Phanerochaete sordida TaxID=48140 RepID=A0A9P3G4R6_9APHY|nr:D123 domain-containing protein [Phanerochaete sordida]
MPSTISPPTVFPPTTPEHVLAFQFSSWYPRFAAQSIKSTIVRPLSEEFLEYLNADGVFMPEGADDIPAESSLSDDEKDDESDDEPRRTFAFPELDARIREAVKDYGAVFPKLNFSSPRDAAWMLPAGSPMKCTSPADVYMLLKSSDFVLHDLDPAQLFEGCDAEGGVLPEYKLELVLRKWYPVDRSRELRCFVRRERLIGISQRDPNYYDFWNEPQTQRKVAEAVQNFWEEHIRGKWESTEGNYTFDFLLTRDLARGHIIDFNPYSPKTDPQLFTYEELLALLNDAIASPNFLAEFRVVDSPSHPSATRNAPAHQHNMVPIEALMLSSGRNVEEFADVWQQELRRSTGDHEDEER